MSYNTLVNKTEKAGRRALRARLPNVRRTDNPWVRAREPAKPFVDRHEASKFVPGKRSYLSRFLRLFRGK